MSRSSATCRFVLVALREPVAAEALQVVGGRFAGGGLVLREAVGQVLGQVEGGAALGDGDRGPQRLRVIGEQGRHLRRGAQEKLGVGATLAVGAVEGGAVADGDEDILEAVAFWPVVVDVAGGDVGDAHPVRQGDQRADALGVAVDQILLQLDGDVFRAEPLDIPAQGRLGLASFGRHRPGGRAARGGSR